MSARRRDSRKKSPPYGDTPYPPFIRTGFMLSSLLLAGAVVGDSGTHERR